MAMQWNALNIDPRGDVTELAYFDVHRKLTRAGRDKEYARVVTRYDQRGNQIESAYFGVDNKPVMLELGYHSIGERSTATITQ